jgi:hypothetical protein
MAVAEVARHNLKKCVFELGATLAHRADRPLMLLSRA